jgi:hypothetical protein
MPDPATSSPEPLSVAELGELYELLLRYWHSVNSASKTMEWHVIGAAYTTVSAEYRAQRWPS